MRDAVPVFPRGFSRWIHCGQGSARLVRLAVVNLTGGGLSGGYYKYLQTLLPLLEADPRVSEMSVFLPEGIDDSMFSFKSPRTFFSPGHSRAAQNALRASVLAFRPDVVFVPTSRWRDFGGVPTVVMVRNMEPLDVPFAGNGVIDSLKNILRRSATKRSYRRADGVIPVSGYVNDWLRSHWSIVPRRVRIIYHGVYPANKTTEQVPQKFANHVSEKFIFTAGSIRPARGLNDLFEAFAQLGPDARHLRLVIAGGVDRGAEHYHAKLLELAGELGIADRIIWLGPISPPEMAWCFQHTDLFVTTSRSEACPNTVLEAMSFGAHIVAGDKPPMPEFLQETALYYELGDSESLNGAIQEALGSRPEDIAKRKRDAVTIASGFTWQRTADETISFLASFCGDRI